MINNKEKKEIARPPVVVVLGHIDHGKTALLDYIRKTNVVEKEAGGITQHVGAYEIEHQGKKITFVDTPGHEAFSQIRSRGAKAADIAVLVVDATEGVKAQTKEAISHIKIAQIPLIVAINKIDKPEADSNKAKRELFQEGVIVESMGGEVPSVETSAVTGKGVSDLLDLILLIAEMEGLKADLSLPAQGVVIESYLDKKRGPTATLILMEGILKPGQIIGTPSAFGKIRILEDFQGRPISQAFPSQPAVAVGFEKVPFVGENFKVFASVEEAKEKMEKEKGKVFLEALDVEEGEKILNLIIKADVLGSLEAIEQIIKSLPRDKGVVPRILKGEVGEVNENDVKLASQAKATILGFRIKTGTQAALLAEREKIRIRHFEIIYELIEEVRRLMEKMIMPEIVRNDLGRLKVSVVFLTEKNRQIVGGKVIEGEVKKGSLLEIERGQEIIGKGKIVNLQKNKKNIEAAGKGEEAAILYEGKEKIEEGDILMIYTEEKKKITF